MKVIFHSLFVLFCTMALQNQAMAAAGGYDHGNGGDMCENRFKTVRDELSAWIMKGGSKDLRLPAGVSHEKYTHDMLEKIQVAKVSCIDEKIFIGSAEKTCKNFAEADGSLSIQCNENRFMTTSMTTSKSDLYILVHHEYAGLAGFEVNTGEDSNYEISNQITRELLNIRIVAVRATLRFIAKVVTLSEQSPDDHARKNNTICMFIGRMNEGDITQELYRQLVSLDPAGSSMMVSKLRLNIMGLMNYCTDNIVKEDTHPIHFEDASALQARINEIQQQLSEIESYLDQRFPN